MTARIGVSVGLSNGVLNRTRIVLIHSVLRLAIIDFAVDVLSRRLRHICPFSSERIVRLNPLLRLRMLQHADRGGSNSRIVRPRIDVYINLDGRRPRVLVDHCGLIVASVLTG